MKLVIFRYSLILILAGFIISIIIGAGILQFPFILDQGSLSFINALFLAVSSITCTGLTPVPMTTLSSFGKLVVIILMYVGSIGLLTLLLGLIFYFAFHAITWYGLASEILEIIEIKQMYFFFRIIFFLSFICIIFGSLFFYCISVHYGYYISFINSLFITVNLFCNVGFPVFGLLPEALFHSAAWYGAASCLIMFGSIGFLAVFEIIQYVRNKIDNVSYKFSMTFILMMKMYFLTVGLAWLFYLIFCEGRLDLVSFFRSCFAAFSIRSCGICPYVVLPKGLIFVSALYGVLGSGPLGTGSGIKTSIIGILFYTLLSFFKKNNNVIIHFKKISWIMVAYAHIFLLYILGFALFLSVLIDLYYEFNFDFLLLYADVLGWITGCGATWTSLMDKIDISIKIIVSIVMCLSKISTIVFSISLSKLKKNLVQYADAKLIII